MENKDLKIAYKRKGLWFGGLLILCGMLFLLSNVNASWQVWRPVFFSWQMLIILIGIFHFCGRHYLMGAFVTIVGIFFFLPVLANDFPMTFGWIPSDFVNQYWALLVVSAGVLIVLNVIFGKQHHHYHHRGRHYHYKYHKYRDQWNKDNCFIKYSNEGMIERNLVFCGGDEIFLEPEFRGGRISCVCGGFKLNLRKTTLPEGETFLDIHCVCGGVEIYVPENWHVEIRTSNILGGSCDSRFKGVEIDHSRKLIIAGDCVLGGVDIK
ncbi:MAG: cell wall-active antibiotics response protein [Paludibacter sp.]|nr:cell wall-active antibiotics response protein [Paludibacter sp.]